jgi:hypothetical protein
MAKNCCRKRPCSICRKWFLPDVRQKGRQKTCGPVCRKEYHRRQCEKWNKKNKADYTNNYLAKKLEKAVEQQSLVKSCSHGKRAGPSLPIDVIVTEFGIKSAVIVQYLVNRIIGHTHVRIHSPP